MPASPMNVLMIAVDDLRPAINALGDARAITPNLDKLVRSGIGFTNAHCQHPICTASRACALTGCRPEKTKVHFLNTRLADANPTLPTLPQAFRAADYETISIGKIYHHEDDDPAGWSRHVPVANHHPTHALPENIALNDAWRAAHARGDRSARRAPSVECADLPDQAYVDAEIAAKGIAAMKETRDRPFFVATGFAKPHLPFTCPKKYWDLYDRDALAAEVPSAPLINPAPATLHEWGELRSYAGTPRDPDPIPPAQRAELIHGYYACVSYLDAQIGKLLDGLDELGLRDSTVVCLWADHGLVLGEYELWAKHTLLDAATRVPLVIRDPRRSDAGKSCEHIVELIDMFPTIAAICDVPLAAPVDGVNLLPLLDGHANNWRDAAFSEYPRQKDLWGYSIRTPEYRYTMWRKRDGTASDQIELYDLCRTGIETENVVARPEYADVVRDLSTRLARAIGDAVRP